MVFFIKAKQACPEWIGLNLFQHFLRNQLRILQNQNETDTPIVLFWWGTHYCQVGYVVFNCVLLIEILPAITSWTLYFQSQFYMSDIIFINVFGTMNNFFINCNVEFRGT